MTAHHRHFPLPQLWFLAAGFLFTALNFEINGVGILLPTFAGHLLIAAGCWQLRERVLIFKYAAFSAIAMAFLTFPYFVRGLADFSGYIDLIFWPELILQSGVTLLVAAGLWRVAEFRDVLWLKITSLLTVLMIVAGLTCWWCLQEYGGSELTKVLSFYSYEFPEFYLSGVTAFAAKRLG